MTQHSCNAGANEPGTTSFLEEPLPTTDAQRLFDDDVRGLGYIMNISRLWAHDPAALDALSDLLGQVTRAGSLTHRQRAILIACCASTLGDSYCSLAWGKKLADEAGAEVAAGVLRGDDAPLDDPDRALARWARQLARDPNSTTAWWAAFEDGVEHDAECGAAAEVDAQGRPREAAVADGERGVKAVPGERAERSTDSDGCDDVAVAAA